MAALDCVLSLVLAATVGGASHITVRDGERQHGSSLRRGSLARADL